MYRQLVDGSCWQEMLFGEALDAGCEGEPWTAMAGRLWQSHVGTDQVDGRRWAFWKRRLEASREDPRLDPEMADKHYKYRE